MTEKHRMYLIKKTRNIQKLCPFAPHIVFECGMLIRHLSNGSGKEWSLLAIRVMNSINRSITDIK